MTFKTLLLLTLLTTLRAGALPSKIVGGNVASEGQLPYHAGIIIDGTRICGASLISAEYLLTAAHCIHKAQTMEVHLGAEQIYDPDEPGHLILQASEKIIHENFDLVGNKFDIALVKLPVQVEQANVMPIPMPTWSQQNLTFDGLAARMSGWGNIDDTIPGISNNLRFVDFNVISTGMCQETYGTDIVTECSICTDSENGKLGFCNGDAGGPLALLDENNSAQSLVGIASFGNPFACESGSPLVFVRITCYLQWISDKTGMAINP